MDYSVNGTTPIARRGRPPRFRDSDVIQAVQALGLEGISLAKIARHIGVSTPALYRVFTGLEDIVELCIADAFELCRVDETPLGVKETVENACKLIWKIYDHYPGLSTMVMNYPFSPKIYLNQLSQFASHFSQIGFSEADVALIFRHVPLILASHHSVYEHQKRDRQLAGDAHNNLADIWLSGTSAENAEAMPEEQIDALKNYARFLVMDWGSAWGCVQDIMRLTSVGWDI